jgi:hypothetical protein
MAKSTEQDSLRSFHLVKNFAAVYGILCRVQTCPHLDFILSKYNPFQILNRYLPSINFNVIILSMSRPPNFSHPFRISDQNFVMNFSCVTCPMCLDLIPIWTFICSVSRIYQQEKHEKHVKLFKKRSRRKERIWVYKRRRGNNIKNALKDIVCGLVSCGWWQRKITGFLTTAMNSRAL